ncbi:hypothetical protein K461DRAFT_297375 [Myriangium duriaei CBS 260.36]|uniref:HIT-type domain-containing protein n=1 Tax=Myriangium duriaei CBS 260.36 TaxID=1168546 RepID=A0A9P4MCL9_9PEZI|nr:hypothetical protein K461DRAFT_297375 [Myriangium duriaei CBS 260.36]
MVQIEELQSSAKAAAPGWSYVVDTGYDPSKVAINPTSRKRLRTGQPESASDLTLRQQTAIQRHLAELDKDSHREVSIPTPKSIFNKKQSVNVKRVLGSGKTFQHYLEEEEARIAQKGPGADPYDTAQPRLVQAQRPSKTPIARRKSAITSATASSAETTPAPTAEKGPQTKSTAATPQVDVTPKPIFQPGTILAQPVAPTISEEEIEALLSAPMLTYNAARSAPPPPTTAKHRVFCEICGYWGRVKCIKCGARVCGIECKDTHDESRCLKFYA